MNVFWGMLCLLLMVGVQDVSWSLLDDFMGGVESGWWRVSVRVACLRAFTKPRTCELSTGGYKIIKEKIKRRRGWKDM